MVLVMFFVTHSLQSLTGLGWVNMKVPQKDLYMEGMTHRNIKGAGAIPV